MPVAVDNRFAVAVTGGQWGDGASSSLRSTGAAASVSVSHIDTVTEGSFTIISHMDSGDGFEIVVEHAPRNLTR